MTQKVVVYISTEDGSDTNGHIHFILPDDRKASYSFSTESGSVKIISPFSKEQIQKIKIVPISDYWTVTLEVTSNSIRARCPKIHYEDRKSFRNIVSPRLPFDGRGIKIGIIDRGFFEMRHSAVQFDGVFDIKGNLLEPIDGAYDDPEVIHGSMVASLITANFDDPQQTAFLAGSKLYACSIPPDPDYPSAYDYRYLSHAVKVLVDKAQVDIINCSAGAAIHHHLTDCSDDTQEQMLEPFLRAVEYAKSRGVIIVAASGNNANMPVHTPAALTDVVAVAGFGVCGVAQQLCDMYLAEQNALARGLVGATANGNIFIDPDCSTGPEVNLFAPSRGIIHSIFRSGRCWEYVGTSYAAPIVTAALAARIKAENLDKLEIIKDYQGYVSKLVQSVSSSIEFRHDVSTIRALSC